MEQHVKMLKEILEATKKYPDRGLRDLLYQDVVEYVRGIEPKAAQLERILFSDEATPEEREEARNALVVCTAQIPGYMDALYAVHDMTRRAVKVSKQ